MLEMAFQIEERTQSGCAPGILDAYPLRASFVRQRFDEYAENVHGQARISRATYKAVAANDEKPSFARDAV